MRALLIVIAIAGSAQASPRSRYDVVWSTAAFGFGASPELSGGIADRLVREPCESTCPLSARIAIGGGAKRWGVEIQGGGSPLVDEKATDYRDRDRNAIRVGPLLRYSLLRGYGFDLSVRSGVQFGGVIGSPSSTSMPDPNCPLSHEGMCEPVTMTYEPETYSLFALPLGATVRLGVRADNGFFGVFADYDVTLVRIGFPDEARYGAMRTIMYGFTFGMMHDL